MSAINDVLDAVVSRVESLSLTFLGNAIPVGKRKHPRQEDGEARHTQFGVSHEERGHEVVRFDSLSDKHTYKVALVFWTPSNSDNVANLPELSGLEDAARDAFNGDPADLVGLDGMLDVDATDGTFLDESAFFMTGWDAGLTRVTVQLVKARG